MKIIEENEDFVQFADYPAKPSRLIYLASLILTITGSISTQSFEPSAIIEFFLISSVILYTPIFFYFWYTGRHPLTITLNREEDLLLIEHHSFFHRDPVLLPLSSIRRITFEPVINIYFIVPRSVYASCRITFILEDNTVFQKTGNIFYFETYERVTKKIADIIGVPFDDKKI